MNTNHLAAQITPRVDSELASMMDGVFADYHKTVTRAVPGEGLTLDRTLWSRLDELGLIRLTGSEQSGGSGAGWLEAAELLTAAVRHGVRTPVAEHDLLACWALESAGLPVDDAVRTVLSVPRSGAAPAVPWASEADRLVVVWMIGEAASIAEIDSESASITPGANRIGEPRNLVTVDTAILDGVTIPVDTVSLLNRKSAMIRAIQVCAALDNAVTLSIEHVASRTQFGRALGKFQAIQNLISDAAAEAVLARSATEAALGLAIETDWRATRLDFLIAVARSCTGHAASVVTRNAHQVHGAMGTTNEHRLHDYTRAALTWRSEFGSVRFWDAEVAAAAVDAGRAGLWALISNDA